MAMIIEFVASKLAGLVLDKVLESFGQQMEVEHGILLGRLAALDSKVDTQLLAPLRSGLTFLRIGDIGQALTEFVHAQANDPYAAASALGLGLLLQKSGHVAEGKQFIEQAVQMNPYIMEGLIPQLPPAPGPGLSITSSGQQIWRISLLDKAFLATLPRRPLHFFPSYFAVRASAAVRSISTVALCPVVSWALGGNLRDEPEQFVSVLHPESGACLWTQSLAGSSLYFVTPRFVILKSNENPPMFKLVDIVSGSILKAMSDEYFRLAFLGGTHKLPMGSLSSNYHRDLMPLDEAYERTTVKNTDRGLKALIRIWDHDYITFVEKETIPLSSLPKTRYFTVENSWSHAHVTWGQGGAACGLWASTEIACTSLGRG